MQAEHEDLLIEARGVMKRYGRRVALPPTSIHVRAGEVVGVLGEPGSGKSTLLRLVAGVAGPSGGELRVLGVRPGTRSKRHVAYLTEHDDTYPQWRVRDAIHFQTALQGRSQGRALELLDALGVNPNARLASLPRGARSRARLALTFARDARVYLLDAPLAGTSADIRTDVLGALLMQRPPGSGVLLAARDASELEGFVSRVVPLPGVWGTPRPAPPPPLPPLERS